MKKFFHTAFIFTVSIAFCQERNLTNHSAEDRYASYSPDGEKILFESNREGNWDLFLMSEDGDDVKQLTSDDSDDRRPSWHPSGSKILFESNRNGRNQLFELDLSNRSITKIGIADSFSEIIFSNYSPNGRQIAFSSKRKDEDPNLYIADVSGDNLRQVTNNNFRTLYPNWSPDGSRLVFFSRHETNNEDDEIYTINLDGTNIQRLTNWPKHNFCPRWSPDGNLITYVTSMENSRPEIYVMNADGSNQTRITNNEDGDTLPAWSPNGTKLLVTGFRNGNYEICEIILPDLN